MVFRKDWTPEFVTWLVVAVGHQAAHAADQENSKFSGLRAPATKSSIVG